MCMCRKKFRKMRKLALKCPILNPPECSGALILGLLNSGFKGRIHFDGLAFFTPTWEVPHIGKSAALHWLHGLNLANIFALKKDAFAIRLVDQREPRAVGIDAGESLNEIIQRKIKMLGDTGDLFIVHSHIARPAAAIATALTEVVRRRHARWKSVGHTVDGSP